MTELPADREKALERIAAGWGRTATAAHPLCNCADRPHEPDHLPPCTRCGAGRNTRCLQPGPVCGKASDVRRRRRIRDFMAAFDCPVHVNSSRQG